MSEHLQTYPEWVTTLITDYASTVTDLRALGLSDYEARQWCSQTQPRALAPVDAVTVPLLRRPPIDGAGSAVVAVVPSEDLARRYLSLGAYLRARSLRTQIRLTASYLATDTDGRIEEIYPITRRLRLGSVAALAGVGGPIAAAVHAESGALETWPDETAYFELDRRAAIPLGLPLGYKPNPMKPSQSSALRAVSHAHLHELLNAAKTGAGFVDVPRL